VSRLALRTSRPSGDSWEAMASRVDIGDAASQVQVRVGVDRGGVVSQQCKRVVETVRLRYFLATLFVPQTSSTPEDPHPLIIGLLRTATQNPR
jgi:CTP synthase (UTP-ammonia lyase)